MTAADRSAGQRRSLRERPCQGAFEFVHLPGLPAVPGQIGPAEERYLYWLTSATYTGAGAVVEVGSWLGRSAICLGAGLRDGGVPGALHCFDRFCWDQKQDLDLGLAPGDDTLPLFLAHVRPVFPAVRATKTEIKKLAWDGGPVEILFLDAPKALGPFLKVLKTFGPWLEPGQSLVATQDFGLPTAYAQVLGCALLEEQLELVHVAANTAGFVVRKPLPARRELERLLDLDALGPARAQALWERMLGRLADDGLRQRLAPGICLHLYAAGHRDLACRLIQSLPFGDWMRKRWREWAARPEMIEKYGGLYRALGLLEGDARAEST